MGSRLVRLAFEAEVKVDGEDYLIMKESDIMGVVEGVHVVSAAA